MKYFILSFMGSFVLFAMVYFKVLLQHSYVKLTYSKMSLTEVSKEMFIYLHTLGKSLNSIKQGSGLV
jgi:hypothetical protein